jgi:hypothetical protein
MRSIRAQKNPTLGNRILIGLPRIGERKAGQKADLEKDQAIRAYFFL